MFRRFKEQLTKLLSRVSEKELKERDLEKYLEDLKVFLVKNDVALETAETIINDVKTRMIGTKIPRFSDISQIIKKSLKNVLSDILSNSEKLDFYGLIRANKEKGKVTKIVFLGINGVGKTLTIAKLAHILKEMGYKVVLACSDTFRAGAIEQLEKHAFKIGVEMIKRPYGADPASVAYDAIAHAMARSLDIVMVDTAGRMHTNINLMDELRKIVRVVEPDLTILVVDALAGHDALVQSKQFLETIGFDGVIMTKVDANVTCGSIFSIVHQTKKPILFLGTGSRYEDLKPFNAEEFLSIIIGD